jgi:hypothetical protein
MGDEINDDLLLSQGRLSSVKPRFLADSEKIAPGL